MLFRSHIVAHDVPCAAQTGKHLLQTQNVSEQNQKHFFVSATNVARAGKRGNICVGNNVSSFAGAFRPFVATRLIPVKNFEQIRAKPIAI